jgi:Phage tail repeat like
MSARNWTLNGALYGISSSDVPEGSPNFLLGGQYYLIWPQMMADMGADVARVQQAASTAAQAQALAEGHRDATAQSAGAAQQAATAVQAIYGSLSEVQLAVSAAGDARDQAQQAASTAGEHAEAAQASAGQAQEMIGAHAGRTDNPHGVTAAQIGVYTRAEMDAALASLLPMTGGTVTGDVTFADRGWTNSVKITGVSPSLRFDEDDGSSSAVVGVNGGAFYLLRDVGDDGVYDASPYPLQVDLQTMDARMGGRLGLGGVAPAGMLHVSGNSTTHTDDAIIESFQPGLQFRDRTTGANYFRVFADGNRLYMGAFDGATTSHAFDIWGPTGSIGIGTASANSNYALNVGGSFGADGTRLGINNALTITDEVLTASRASYGMQSAVTNGQFSPSGSYVQSVFGTHSIINNGSANDAPGSIDTAVAARNYILNRAGTAGGGTGTITSAFGSYNYIYNHRSGSTINNAYGTYNYLRRDAGTFTQAFGVYNNFTGTFGTKWGFYSVGDDKSFLTGRLGLGVDPVEKLHVAGNGRFVGKLWASVTESDFGAAGVLNLNTPAKLDASTAITFGEGAAILLGARDATGLAVGEGYAPIVWANQGSNGGTSNTAIAPIVEASGNPGLGFWTGRSLAMKLAADGNATLYGHVSSNGKDFYSNNGAFISNDAAGAAPAVRTASTNVDHLWHNDTTNEWHLVSDGPYKSTGNATLVAGTAKFTTAPTVGGSAVWHAGSFDPASKANAVHTHTVASVTGLQAALDGKAPTGHTHDIAQVSGLQAALDAKAPLTGAAYSGQVTVNTAQDWGTGHAFESRATGTGTGATPALIAFHRPNSYAIKLGLDTDNQIKIGGWSAGANKYVIWHAGNFNPGSYVDWGTHLAKYSVGCYIHVAGSLAVDEIANGVTRSIIVFSSYYNFASGANHGHIGGTWVSRGWSGQNALMQRIA